jgi:hypothetical protein
MAGALLAQDRQDGPGDVQDAVAALVLEHVPELGDHATRFCGAAVMMIGAVWTHARPSKSLVAAYEADPSLTALRMDFTDRLQQILATLIAGTLARVRH